MNSSIPASSRHQRKWRNFLLDKKFQLKYTGYLLAVAGLLGLTLGWLVYNTSAEVMEQSSRNAKQGQQIVELGQEVVAESRKVSAVVRMNIIKDPVYQAEPDLLSAFNAEAAEQDKKFDRQQAQLNDQYRSLVEHSEQLRRSQRGLQWTIAIGLLIMVIGIGLAGIVVTHRVAGPIFKMKRHLRDVAKGHLQVPWGLRRGDELVDFFEGFRKMVASLRQEREGQIAILRKSVDELEELVPEEKLSDLKGLAQRLENSLK